MYYIGVDPGKKGGLAIMEDHKVVSVIPMPVAGKELDLNRIRDWILEHTHAKEAEAWIEKVSAMPKQGVTSMFTFGFGTGSIHGIMAALFIPRLVVRPQAWKADILAGTSKDKVAAIDWCSRTYPEVNLIPDGCRVPHNGMADALCISTYGVYRR